MQVRASISTCHRHASTLGVADGCPLHPVEVAEAQVQSLAKGVVSRTYGDRKVDEYLKDDAFWRDKLTGNGLRKGSREAAMLIIVSREA